MTPSVKFSIYTSIEYSTMLIQLSKYISQVMLSLRFIGRTLLRINAHSGRFAFSSKDSWKDRDEASQKVYITEHERDTLKKLLKKVEQEQQSSISNNVEFETKLKDILKKHQVKNEAFFSEVSNLHKSL